MHLANGPGYSSRSIAATDELPMANIGSTAIVSLSPNPRGLKNNIDRVLAFPHRGRGP